MNPSYVGRIPGRARQETYRRDVCADFRRAPKDVLDGVTARAFPTALIDHGGRLVDACRDELKVRGVVPEDVSVDEVLDGFRVWEPTADQELESVQRLLS